LVNSSSVIACSALSAVARMVTAPIRVSGTISISGRMPLTGMSPTGASLTHTADIAV
jgi:hypothetical protein